MIESEKNIGQPTVELTNMVMVEDKKSGKVLVQENQELAWGFVPRRAY